MRAKEFIIEYKLSVSKDANGVAVKATAGGKPLGHAEFFFDGQGRLDPQTVWVDERYHGQGIARDMYDHLKDLGYTIIRSWDQTDAGRGFWDKHRGEDAQVWEGELTEFAPGPDRDHNDDVPDPIFVLANRWWNAAEKQPQIESVLNSMGWSIRQVESEDDAVQLQHRDGTSYFISADDFDPDVFEDVDQTQPEVYLDMDGVLADFMAGYNRVAGTNYKPGQQLPHPSEDPTLKKITGTNFFSKLPKFASANALVRMVIDQYGHYNICSSPLRGDHENSAANKRAWLTANLQPQPQEIVITSRKEKYATQPDGTPNILVDDKPENVQRWKAAGGIGILYNAAVDDLDTVAQGLQLNENFADVRPIIDMLEEGNQEIARWLEENPTLLESQEGWSEIKSLFDRITGDQPAIGKTYAVLNLIAVPPGRMLLQQGSSTPAPLIDIIDQGSYQQYEFDMGNRRVRYPEDHRAGDQLSRTFLFQNPATLDRIQTLITLSLQGWEIRNRLDENFADGKKPGRKGLSKRVGIPKKATLAQLQKIASSSTGERRRMAQWQLNMRRGRAKKAK